MALVCDKTRKHFIHKYPYILQKILFIISRILYHPSDLQKEMCLKQNRERSVFFFYPECLQKLPKVADGKMTEAQTAALSLQ